MKPTNHRLAERVLIDLLRRGEWEIDADGAIWRVALRAGRGGAAAGLRISPCARRRVERRMSHGYLVVRAMIDGRRVVGLAHRLVWQHARGDIAEGLVINHLNGVKDDNRLANLEVVSASENTKHAYRTGLKDEHGERNPAVKLSDHDVALVRNAYASGAHKMKDLARRHGVSVQHISKLVRGDRRPRQLGPTEESDHRHASPDRDARGRFAAVSP